MERVRVVVCGLLLALGLLSCPMTALASDGFIGGLEDLVGVRDGVEDVDYEEELRSELGTGTRADPPMTPNTLSDIQDAVYAWTIVPLDSNRVSLMAFLRWVFTGRAYGSAAPLAWSPALLAVGFVFLWWGVRKSIRMVMSSFRKGSLKA